MAILKTRFVGLDLQSPIIASSCGLTADIKKMEEMQKCGVGAVVLKSIFEEQINQEVEHNIGDDSFQEGDDYIQHYIRANTINKYIELVKQAKEKLYIPVIGSICCMDDGAWIDFACELEKAGVNAIELNTFMLPTDVFEESAVVESKYFDIIRHVKSVVNIPVIVKIGKYFTNLPSFVSKLKAYGADGVTIFNRYYAPDINIENMTIGSAYVYSSEKELPDTLRWTGILSGKDRRLELAASTGIHSGNDVIKVLLAGAKVAQVCSVLYDKGPEVIQEMNGVIRNWMDTKGFATLEDFRGSMTHGDIEHANRYERAQFMKYFSNNK